MVALPLVAAVLALAGLLGCSSAESDSSSAARAESAELRIVFWPKGRQKAARSVRWTLRCGPIGGTLPRRERACDRLLALNRPFGPVPRGRACTEIYGGPQVAEVRGRLRGRAVAARFTRTDGCQIARWNRVSFLFRT
jgi:hypothetical protein